MAYKQKHQYGYRDSLDKGDPEKVIYGSHFDDEFKAIEEAIADIDPNADGGVDIGEIDGLQDALDGKADKDHTHDEYLTDAPNDGKQYVRESEAWAEVVIPDDTGIPEPSADATPYARQVEGGQTVGAWVEAATPEDIEYLDGRIDAIEGNISGGGGFVEAPDDGADYARNGKSPAWVKTYNADYIDDLETGYKNADAGKADKDHTHEIADVDGLQDALDAAGGAPAWDDVTGKPTDFPPSAHSHGWDQITGKPTEFPPEAHSHTTDQITGLDTELDGIKEDINDLEGAVGELTGQLAFGGSYNATTGKVITGNLSGFVSGSDLPDYSTVPNTFVIVAVSGDNPEELGEGDWLVAGSAGWVAIKYGTAGSVEWDNIVDRPTEFPPSPHGHAWDEITGKPTEFPPASHNHNGVYQPVGNYIEDADSDGKQYARQDGAWSEIVIPDGGSGSSVHIGDTPPDSPQEGQQWMEVPVDGDATMWIYCLDADGKGLWLQQPGGKDGKDGADGVDGLWTDEGNGSISYDGNVVVGGATADTSLAVKHTGGTVAKFEGTGSEAYIGFTSADTTNNWWHQGIGASGNDLKLKTGNQVRLTIEESGSATFSGTVNATNGSVRSTAFQIGSGNQGYLYSDSQIDGEVLLATKNVAGETKGYFAFRGLDNGEFLIRATNSKLRIGTGGSADTNGMTISSPGDATFKGTVNATSGSTQLDRGVYRVHPTGAGIRCTTTSSIYPTNGAGEYKNNLIDLGSDSYKWKQVFAVTTRSQRVIQDGSPVVDAKGLIKTLSTLRNATKDETTIEGLRDAIGNAIGGLIEEFENQIATMPAEDSE